MKTPLNSIADSKERVNLPLPLKRVAELSVQQLGRAFAKMLDALDDRLFELAEGAGAAIEQNSYFEAMREVRIGRRAAERSFVQEIENAFRLLCGPALAAGSPAANEMPAEIELQEFKTRMLSKFKAKSSVELYKLTLRMDAISDDFFVSDKNNPLTYSKLQGYFDAAMRPLNVNSKVALIVVKLFDQFVINTLSTLLSEANTLLAADGILPEVTHVSDLNKQILPSANDAELNEPQPAQAHGTFLHLQQLMTLDSVANKKEHAHKTETILSKMELLSILSSLQRKVLALGKKNETPLLQDVRSQITIILVARQDQFSGSSLGPADEDVIQLVTMLINAILADRYLPDQVKASICHLQIPLIKVGIMDHTLFGERAHAARHFINELARIGVDNHGKSALLREVVYSKIEESVQRILVNFDEDISIFERELNDVLFYYKQALSHANHLESRAQLAEAGREKTDLARRVVQQHLSILTNNTQIPVVVQKILDECWSNLLLVTLLQEGIESELWHDYMLTAETLVGSVQPGKDAAARRRFLNLAPALLVKIREGLKRNQTDSYAISLILTDLEQAHLTALSVDGVRPAPRVPSANQNTPTNVPSGAMRLQSPVLGDIATITREIVHKASRDELAVSASSFSQEARNQAESLTESSTNATVSLLEPAQVEQWVDQLNLGVWFEVKNSETQTKYRCKLAAYLPGFNQYIFVNRRGVKVMERSRSSLINALVNGEMKILQETQLFDRALQSVVSELRGSKGTST